MPWWENPDWWQVILTVLGATLAYRAFSHERDAVRLTQRADVLVAGVRLLDSVGKDMKVPWHDSYIEITIRNYGPTRASEVVFTDFRLDIGGHRNKMPPERILLPAQVIATQGTSSTRIGPLEALFDRPLVATIGGTGGGNLFRFYVSFTYDDVFGTTHETTCVGLYSPNAGGFANEQQATNTHKNKWWRQKGLNAGRVPPSQP